MNKKKLSKYHFIAFAMPKVLEPKSLQKLDYSELTFPYELCAALITVFFLTYSELYNAWYLILYLVLGVVYTMYLVLLNCEKVEDRLTWITIITTTPFLWAKYIIEVAIFWSLNGLLSTEDSN